MSSSPPPVPEYLEQGSGGPLPPGSGSSRPRSVKKHALLGGAAVLGLSLVGGGIWAATAYFATGAQPAEALPASTIGYVSVDLDPSGEQKLDAMRTLQKFPAFEDELGLDTDDDVRAWIFEQIQEDGACQDLDYADDIEPWLGGRAALAAVDLGEDVPAPLAVIQVKDAEAAESGLAALQECSGEADGGWAVEGDWAVVAETDEIAEQALADAGESALADDEDFQKWTGEAGDAGIVTMYAAPGAGRFLAGALDDFGSPLWGGSAGGAIGPDGELTPIVPPELAETLEDFEGMAATVRFDDGSLELEYAGGSLGQTKLPTGDAGADVVSTLPQDTAAAFGIGFDEGWFSDFVEAMSTGSGGALSAEDLVEELSAASGLDLPEDAETLAGESLAISLGGDFDPETFFNSEDGSGVPVAAKVSGDPEEIESVLDKIRSQLGVEDGPPLESESEGDMIAVGPSTDYLSEVVSDGDLGGTDLFKDVVRDADAASAVVFVNFDAGDGWLAELAGDDADVADNLAPLAGLGMSAWTADAVTHMVLRVTTD